MDQMEGQNLPTNDLFRTIGNKVLGLQTGGDEGADDDDERVKVKIQENGVDDIESLCTNCHENGNTRLLLTMIPHFREVVISSFSCEHCGYSNNSVDPAGEIQTHGSRFIFKIESHGDLQRLILKGDQAIFSLPTIELESSNLTPGRLTNIEGLINDLLAQFQNEQKFLKEENLELYEQIDAKVVQPLIKLMNEPSKNPCQIILDDPTGNSWIEPSPKGEDKRGKWTRTTYPRTDAQNAALGLGETETESSTTPQEEGDGGMKGVNVLKETMLDMRVACPECAKLAFLIPHPVNIPHFKEVIILSTQCDECGFKETNVETGGRVPTKGKRITLKVEGPKDLHRDILKSRSCYVEIPEIPMSFAAGTMGGRFTTLEGLMTQMRDNLKDTAYDMGDESAPSDSMPEETKKEWKDFFTKAGKAIAGEMPYTVIMEDPLADSFCAPLVVPELGYDPQIQVEDYVRTAEQEEELGLTDMKTKLNKDGEYVRDEFDENGELEDLHENIN